MFRKKTNKIPDAMRNSTTDTEIPMKAEELENNYVENLLSTTEEMCKMPYAERIANYQPGILFEGYPVYTTENVYYLDGLNSSMGTMMSINNSLIGGLINTDFDKRSEPIAGRLAKDISTENGMILCEEFSNVMKNIIEVFNNKIYNIIESVNPEFMASVRSGEFNAIRVFGLNVYAIANYVGLSPYSYKDLVSSINSGLIYSKLLVKVNNECTAVYECAKHLLNSLVSRTDFNNYNIIGDIYYNFESNFRRMMMDITTETYLFTEKISAYVKTFMLSPDDISDTFPTFSRLSCYDED